MSHLKNQIVSYLIRQINARNLDFRAIDARLGALKARHALISGISSVDDEVGQPSERLLGLAQKIIVQASNMKLLPLGNLDGRPSMPSWFDQWPGEHYRLLAALIRVIKPKCVLEIGTFTGLSALAMLTALEDDATLTTFDIQPWNELPTSYLLDKDFLKGNFRQIIADLGDPEQVECNADLLRAANLIFIDAAKDGVLERNLLANFERIGLAPDTLLVFDDIRIWNMLEIWRSIKHSKLDLTSFGHWTGSGLVEWNPGRC